MYNLIPFESYFLQYDLLNWLFYNYESLVLQVLPVVFHGALIYDLIALFVQAVIEKERRGDFLGKTVQVC